MVTRNAFYINEEEIPMKLLIYGMDACINCREAKDFLNEHEIPFMYFDITETTGNMKKFLKLRDHDDLFAGVREAGKIGIPCFKLEDGTMTLDMNVVPEKLGRTDLHYREAQC